MWLLKSPKDGKPVDVETFFKNDLNNRITLHSVRLIYEKLSYMMQKDLALLVITKQINNSFHGIRGLPTEICKPTKIYTFSKSEIELFFKNGKHQIYEIADFILRQADRIYYNETVVDCNSDKDDVIINKESSDWREYVPVILIKDFFNDELIKLNKLFYHKNILEGYNKLLKNVYADQQKLAKSIFAETDEEDKIGFLKIYQTIMSFVLHEEREWRRMFLDSENYNFLINEYPLFRGDFDLLQSNDKEAYIRVNKDFSLYWNEEKYGKGCFGQYFIFLKNNRGNMKWEKLKNIFPQFKNDKLENIARGVSQEVIDLLAKVPSFKKLYEDDEIKSRFKDEINEIVKRCRT